jgi:phage-related protein (TIGR01555 family)
MTAEFNTDAGHLQNAMLGFGRLNGADKSSQFTPASQGVSLTRQQRQNLYDYCPAIANAIDLVVDDSLQKYVTYSDKSGGDSAKVQGVLDSAKDAIAEAWKMARIHGWAGVLVFANDTIDLMQPIGKPKAIKGFRAYSGGVSGLLTVAEWDTDPTSLDYGQPLFFSLGKSAQKIHRDRLLLFYGVKKLGGNEEITTNPLEQLGISIIDRVYRDFQNFDVACQSVAASLPTWAQDILGIPDLATLTKDPKALQLYVDGMNQFRSTLNLLAIDTKNGGSWQTITRDYSAMPAVIEKFAQYFAGACNIPDTMLFNQSPSGQTSGRYQSDSWAQWIAQQQQLSLCKPVDRLMAIAHSIYGAPQDWELHYPSILTLSAVELANLDKTKADTIKSLGSAITPEEARKSLEDDVPIGKVLDNDAWESFDNAIAEQPTDPAPTISAPSPTKGRGFGKPRTN